MIKDDKELLKLFLDKAIYIIMKDGFHYQGMCTRLSDNFLLIEDRKVGLLPIRYNNIDKIEFLRGSNE